MRHLKRLARTHAAVQGTFTPLRPNLFRIDDTCNVYLIKDRRRAILIDFLTMDVMRAGCSLASVALVVALISACSQPTSRPRELQAVTTRSPATQTAPTSTVYSGSIQLGIADSGRTIAVAMALKSMLSIPRSRVSSTRAKTTGFCGGLALNPG